MKQPYEVFFSLAWTQKKNTINPSAFEMIVSEPSSSWTIRDSEHDQDKCNEIDNSRSYDYEPNDKGYGRKMKLFPQEVDICTLDGIPSEGLKFDRILGVSA